jgi:hypothetical protein
MTLSIIVPVHNEAQGLRQRIQEFQQALEQPVRSLLMEILLVENGSRDETWRVCRELEAGFPLVRALQSPRASYGEAIKLGMMSARGTHLSILEVDVMSPAFVADSVERMERGAEFVVGSKRHREATDRRPWKRRLLTWGFNSILRLALGYPGTDTHGLKSIETGLARELCRLAITSDEVFQTEIVLLAWRLGNEISEAPVDIAETRPTPVPILKRIPKVIGMVHQLRRSVRRIPRVPRPAVRHTTAANR